jgi:ATP-binding cassette subfamily F protein uup
MPPPLLQLQDIHLSLGTAPLLAGAELTVAAGERVALVGRNGSGKSTLLRIAAGTLPADRGSRFVQPGARLSVLAQEPDLAGHATVLDWAMETLEPRDDAHRVPALLAALGLTGAEHPAGLSGGEARRAALAAALAPRPDVLLLDEPTNHLDLPAIEWLEQELLGFRGALVLVSHDRRFLTALSRRMVWLDRGTTRTLDQCFAAFEDWREQVEAEEATAAHKLSRQIAREEDWLRYGVTARRKRNVRRLGQLHALRQQRRRWRAAPGQVQMAAAEAGGGGTTVLAAEQVAFGRGGRTLLRDVTLRVMRGDRLAIVGPNGAGKTTLLRILLGALPPDAGTVRRGTGLSVAWLDQARTALDPSRTLAETLTGGTGDTLWVNGQPRHVHAYMKDFLFPAAQAQTPVGVLSGGERNRLLLARALAAPSNLLVLDEPTNDLDLDTLDLLQEMLADYAGTILLVSHDRDFLDRVATATVLAEGDGRWTEYAGGYSDMVSQRGPAPTPRAAVRPPARPPSPPPPRPARAGLSFTQQHRLKQLPARMEALRSAIARHEAALADPALFARDRTRFERESAALAAAQAELAAAEEEWLELELLRETG